MHISEVCSFLLPNAIPYMAIAQFVNLFACEHMYYLQFGPIINKAAVNTWIQILERTCVSFTLGQIPVHRVGESF